MNFAPVEAIANAVLFEGYMLYPYRASALKNRQRWNFGTLYPRQFAEAQSPSERWRFSAQVIVQGSPATMLSARVRFLQLLAPAENDDPAWQQGFPRSRDVDAVSLSELCNGVERVFDLTSLARDEQFPDFRACPRIGRLALSVQTLREGVYKLTAAFMNESPLPNTPLTRRSVQDVAFTSAHLLLGLQAGEFVSLLEPPPEFEAEAKACAQDGVFSVLVGETGDRSRLLCSPIILYDYPQVAAESPGDFFDGAEIDEMLALRVLTLTEEEKQEMRSGDPRARAILERTESLPNEHFIKLHGAVRGLRRITEAESPITPEQQIQPWDPFAEAPALESIQVLGAELRKGDRVKIWPKKKADILDMAVEGKVAIIEAIEQDLEGALHLAVVLEDDPGRDLGMLRQVGHRFFYSPDEVQPLPLERS